MALETSGVRLDEMDNGDIITGYSDYNVSEFGGATEYEVTFYLSAEHSAILKKYLNETYKTGSLKEKLAREVDENFSEEKFDKLCKKLGISAQRSSWTSFD